MKESLFLFRSFIVLLNTFVLLFVNDIKYYYNSYHFCNIFIIPTLYHFITENYCFFNRNFSFFFVLEKRKIYKQNRKSSATLLPVFLLLIHEFTFNSVWHFPFITNTFSYTVNIFKLVLLCKAIVHYYIFKKDCCNILLWV